MAALYNDALASALSHIYISQCVSNVYIDKLSQLIKYQFALCTLRGHLCLLRPIHSLTYSLIHTHTLDLHSVLIGQVIFDWTICLNGVNLDLHYRSEHLMSQTLAATATSTDRPQTNQNVLSLSLILKISLSLSRPLCLSSNIDSACCCGSVMLHTNKHLSLSILPIAVLFHRNMLLRCWIIHVI